MLAIILAARAERDSLVPYPLMEINDGQCLIDRTLTILREEGYDRIIIVSGFRHELFEPYVNDDVEVVFNPDYKFTASMASLSAVRQLVDEDFLLIEGDTFFERSVIEKMTIDHHKTLLAVTEESGNGDEAFVETCEGFITKVSKDRHQICNYCGELIGVIKISLDIYKRMLSLWDNSKNMLLNYEYALLDCTNPLERPYVFMSNLIWGDVDTKEDLHQLKNYTYRKLRRKENPYDEDNIKNYVKMILHEVDDNSLSIAPIGGMSNKNFKVIVHSHEYILRVPGIGASGMVNRDDEEKNSLIACGLGISPSVRYFDPRTGIKLADYVTNAETLNRGTIQRPDNIDKVVSIFLKLHNSGYRLNNDFNVFAEIRRYESLLIKANGHMYDGYTANRERIFALEKELNNLGVELKPCHNDLVPENFIKAADGTLYLIDWEYSGMNDPLWDIAALFLESEFLPDNKELFLNKYYHNSIPDQTEKKILMYQVLMDVLWSIWTCIKESMGDDFGSYGQDRFSRAMNNLNCL